jgi:UDP-N-acetylmuramyl pentapeptide synthase
MKLSALIPELKLSSCLNDLEVSSIHIDSRDVKEGGIFFALKGQNFDGNDYIDEALQC